MLNNISKRNSFIDILKLIAIFGVICIHSPLEGNLGKYIVALSRFAVPFFFLVSGYYLKDIDVCNFGNRIKHLIKITLIANLIYLIYKFIIFLLGFNVDWNNIFSFASFIKFIIFNESPFEIHLWYLNALIYSTCIIYFLPKSYKYTNNYLIFLFILIFLDIIITNYFPIFGYSVISHIYTRNFIFEGMPFLLFGNLIYKNRTKIQNIDNKYCLFFIIFFIVTTLIEKFIFIGYNIETIGGLYFSTPFLALFIFILGLKNPFNIKLNSFSECIMYMYILHMLVVRICSFLFKHNNTYYTYSPIIVFFITLIFAFLCIKLKSIISKIMNKYDLPFKHY